MMPDYDPRAKLDDEKEGWIALAKYGGAFLSRAASELTRGLPHDERCDWECRYWLVFSALGRGDAAQARVFVNDWSRSRRSWGKSVTVSKFIPGDHYHVAGRKFDTLGEAINHIRAEGWRYAGLVETHVYANEGD